jgi:hypothetical protein
MKQFLIILCVFTLTLQTGRTFSQKENEEINLTKEQWQLLYDSYAVMTIKLLAKLDTLNKKVDSIKSLLSEKETEYTECENEMLSITGITENELADYRKKFDETEKRIMNKNGTPADARKMYFDEISAGNIKCLPEFSGRYSEMKKILENAEGIKETEITEKETQKPREINPAEGTYLVVEGDCLLTISEHFYRSPGYWRNIWEANKEGVVNKDEIPLPSQKTIKDPNLIYPGQILRIPRIE